jgi:hypothetical protein
MVIGGPMDELKENQSLKEFVSYIFSRYMVPEALIWVGLEVAYRLGKCDEQKERIRRMESVDAS